MLEDGLKDMKNTKKQETKNLTEDNKREVITDNVGVYYLKVVNHVSFDEAAIYTVEVPASQHATPEVKEVKIDRSK